MARKGGTLGNVPSEYGFEWKSRIRYGRYPLIHIAVGRGADGKIRVARGVIAIGQFGVGLVTIAQCGVGFLFGIGQAILAPIVIAQVAVGVIFGVGQIAAGHAAIGQIVFAQYGLAQAGLARHLWSMTVKDPEAVEFFSHLFEASLTSFGLK